jgi:hypothetical protein
MKNIKDNYLHDIYFEIKDFIQEAKIFNDLELIMNNLEKADFIGIPELNDFLNKLDSVKKYLQEIKKALTSMPIFNHSQNIQNEVIRLNDMQSKIIVLTYKLKP